MLLTIFSILAAVGGGFMLTYLYEDEAGWLTRLAEGVFVGMAVLGLVGFFMSLIVGDLTIAVVILSAALVVGLPLLFILQWKYAHVTAEVRGYVREVIVTIGKPKRFIATAFYFIFFISILAFILDGVMTEIDGGYYTRAIDNYADLTLHTGIVTGFAMGKNFPPQHPDYAGSRLTYPFLVDFLAAMYVKAGLTLPQAFYVQNVVLMSFLVLLFYRWSRELTGSNYVAMLTPVLIMCAGGLGWIIFVKEAFSSGNIGQFLLHLPHDYTSYGETIRWANPLVYWFMPMRSMILGTALFTIVVGIWWRVLSVPRFQLRGSSDFSDRVKRRALHRMVGAGLITALLPLSHGHSFMALILVGVFLGILFRFYLLWFMYFGIAFLFGVPQFLWLFSRTSSQVGKFIGFISGWNSVESNSAKFWIINTGLFIPLTIVALLVKNIVPNRLKRFYVPFILLFIIPNFVKLAPWQWDNVKILAYWYILSVPLVAMVLAGLWGRRGVWRYVVSILIISLIFSGTLDIWHVFSRSNQWQVFAPAIVETAEVLKKEVPPRSVVLTAPTHTNPVLISGRQSFMGYSGRLWTHGIDYFARESEVKEMYQGESSSDELFKKYAISYVIVGPQERAWAQEQQITLNEAFFSRLPVVARVGEITIYRVGS